MITQSLFNTIYRGLQSQCWLQSMHPQRDQCMYRGHKGRKCAIGQALPDEAYIPEMDSEMPYSIIQFHEINMFTELTADEFTELQQAHDLSSGDMRQRFERLAQKHNLEIPQ